MSKMFSPDTPFPMNYDSCISQVWNLHSTFLHNVLDAPNTSQRQKESALELLNMIAWFREEKYGITKGTSDNSQQVASGFDPGTIKPFEPS